MKTITINNFTIPVRLTASARRKRSIAMQIDQQWVHIRTPLRFRMQDVDAFLQKKQHRILKHWQKAQQKATITNDFVKGDAIPFLGKNYPLDLVHGWSTKWSLELLHDRFQLTLPKNTNESQIGELMQKYLKKRYMQQSKEIISREVIRCEKEFGCSVQEIYIKNYKAKYGQCIWQEVFFSYKIVQFPLCIIRHIVCHELAHIEHKNHGPHFKALLRQMDPETPKHEQRIRENGIMLE